MLVGEDAVEGGETIPAVHLLVQLVRVAATQANPAAAAAAAARADLGLELAEGGDDRRDGERLLALHVGEARQMRL